MDRAAQERNDLLSNLSTLEERILSAENERNVLQGKLTSLTEEKAGIENQMTLLRETLQTAEKESLVAEIVEKLENQIIKLNNLKKSYPFVVSWSYFMLIGREEN